MKYRSFVDHITVEKQIVERILEQSKFDAAKLTKDEEDFKQYQLDLCAKAGKKPSFKTRFKAGEGRWFQYLSDKYNISVKSRSVGSALANVKHELI